MSPCTVNGGGRTRGPVSGPRQRRACGWTGWFAAIPRRSRARTPDARCTAVTTWKTSSTFTTSATPKAMRPPMPETADVGPEALDLLTMAEVAGRLRVSEKTVSRMIRQGVFTKLKVGAGVRIDPAQVIAYKKQLHEQAAAAGEGAAPRDPGR